MPLKQRQPEAIPRPLLTAAEHALGDVAVLETTSAEGAADRAAGMPAAPMEGIVDGLKSHAQAMELLEAMKLATEQLVRRADVAYGQDVPEGLALGYEPQPDQLVGLWTIHTARNPRDAAQLTYIAKRTPNDGEQPYWSVNGNQGLQLLPRSNENLISHYVSNSPSGSAGIYLASKHFDSHEAAFGALQAEFLTRGYNVHDGDTSIQSSETQPIIASSFGIA